MLERSIYFSRYENLFRIGAIVFLALSVSIPVFIVSFYLALPRNEEGVECAHIPKDGICHQALFTASTYVWVPEPAIKDQLVYLEYNQRPDAFGKTILLTLKGSQEKRLASIGERIYFHSEDVDKIEFSPTPTPYWASLNSINGGALEITFTTEYKENDKPIYENSRIINLERTGGEKKDEALFSELASMRVYPPDRLIDLYGGELFKEEKGALRLEIGKQVYFVHEGDRFVLSEGRWKEEKKTEGLPLLVIKSINRDKCEYTLWNGDGFSSKSGHFTVERAFPLTLKTSDLFPKVYPRTGNSVTCQFNQKNIVLKEGDWLIRSKAGWRPLHSANEVKKALALGLPGEIFIFDGVQKKNGNTYFVGHLFDEKRTNAQRIEVLLVEKKLRKISPKRISLNQ